MATGNEIIEQAKELADMSRSNFVKPSLWVAWLNDAYAELYDLLIGKFEDYAVEKQTVTCSAGNLALPANFYKLRGVDRDDRTVRSFQFTERNSVDVSNAADGVNQNVRYCLIGQNIMIRPLDRADGDYDLWYIPRLAVIGSGDLSSEIPSISGWEPYLHYTIAIKALVKEESDALPLMQLKADIVRRIEDMAANRDAGEARRIADVQRNDYRFSILGY